MPLCSNSVMLGRTDEQVGRLAANRRFFISSLLQWGEG